MGENCRLPKVKGLSATKDVDETLHAGCHQMSTREENKPKLKMERGELDGQLWTFYSSQSLMGLQSIKNSLEDKKEELLDGRSLALLNNRHGTTGAGITVQYHARIIWYLFNGMSRISYESACTKRECIY